MIMPMLSIPMAPTRLPRLFMALWMGPGNSVIPRIMMNMPMNTLMMLMFLKTFLKSGRLSPQSMDLPFDHIMKVWKELYMLA